MSERVVEMIEELQRELNEPGRHQGRLPEGLAIELSVKLDPILDAAREQAQELAAMKEPGPCGLHPRKYTDMNINLIGQCALCADLRAVAEMAIVAANRGLKPTADSIVREFREKQHRETVCKVHGKHLCAECFPLEQKAVIHSTTCAKQETGLQCTCGAEKKDEVKAQ